MFFDKILENLLKKDFTLDDINSMIGSYDNSYLVYSKNKMIRENAASGGATTIILIELLKNNLIDGALVCKNILKEGKVRTKFYIATTKNEILFSQGSNYVATKFVSEAIPLIREFDGKVGVVGLPCDISALKKRALNDPKLEEKIVLTIALVCGHNSQTKLIDTITNKLENTANSTLKDYRFRKGLWRGELEATFKNKQKISKPFSYFSNYQNLFFFSQKKCLYCFDHFGYDADISIGDVWSYDLKKKGIKFNGLIAKNKKSSLILSNILKRNVLNFEEVDILRILEGQKRAAPFHYNISARHKVGKLLGIAIPDKVKKKIKWHEYISAFIVLINWKWSQSKKYNKYIFKIPKLLLKIYLYLYKGLESLK